ncbi:laccase domain-containing protein 1 isoform X2 [Myripristis murdjan]|uniref:laccase domain-containing protein 1 isoform X2 n=1 Tax=Myripristis murdjan TaxID=586833 RepID=UPI001175E0A0|nr:laccase domain-containing protein 1 isoform X2 [Myripristis murdjan]
MFGVLILDLIHGRCPACNGKSLEQLAAEISPLTAGDALVFLLCGRYFQQANGGSSCGSAPLTEPLLSGRRSVHVLDFDTITECLCRLKQTVDELDLSSVAVLTSRQGKEILLLYQKQLFTEVYSFEYYTSEDQLTCQRCSLAHTDSPGDRVNKEVTTFLQQLPALKGDVTTLTSTLIPDCFGHGFSTRAGGVCSIPTLSSLNLFSSSKRRDGRAVVEENRRRLAVHAGFHPQPLHMVKVNHASDVWVMGKAEPDSYDAIVTNQAGVVLAAPGADCMPILFADPVLKVIGAAHAGWKGTLMGVAMATVGAMVREFGCQVSDIIVAVGPSVGACCFTLGRERAPDFACIHPDCVLDPHSARPHVNIRLANRILLQKGGILPEHIHDDTVADRPCVTPCTSCHPEAFFSHVRDGLNFGTQVGFLWIK